MGTTRTEIDAEARAFIEAQHLFFVASAPAGGGRVNLSPKGLDDTLAVLDERTVAYLDLTGSGIETLAHARTGGSVCLMFCAFEGAPRILRLHGRAEAFEPHEPTFAELRPRFADLPAARSVIRVAVERVTDSCGYGIPVFEYRGQRETLPKWGRAKTAEQIAAFRREHNLESIDGLPGLRGR